MKPHRQIRTSKVSSETGVAIADGNGACGRFETCVNEIEKLLKPFAPDERKSVITALIKRTVKGANTHE